MIKQTVKNYKIINLFINKIYTLTHIHVIIFSIHTYINVFVFQ